MVYKGYFPKRDERIGLANRTNGQPMKPDYFEDEYQQPATSIANVRAQSAVAKSPSVPQHWQRMGTQEKWNDSAARAQSQLTQDRINFQKMVESARDGRQNLTAVGDSIGSPTNYTTDVLADRNNAAESALIRLRDPNGYRRVQSSYVDPNAYAGEQNLRIAQSRMAAERSARDAEFDARMAKHSAQVNADTNQNGVPDRDEAVHDKFGRFGISTINDLATANAKFNSYMRAFRETKPDGQRAMTFDEFARTLNEERKNLPVFGAPGTNRLSYSPSGQFGSDSNVAALINQGNASAKLARQQRSQTPGMLAKSRDAMDQGSAMRASVAARGLGLDPQVAAAETLSNLSAMRAAVARNNMNLDLLTASGVNELARTQAASQGQLSLEELRQRGLAAQRQDARKMDLARLGTDMSGEMGQPLVQLAESTTQDNLNRIKGDPVLLRQYPTGPEQLAAARQMALPIVRAAAAANKAKAAQFTSVGGDGSIFSPWTDESALTQVGTTTGQQPMTLEQFRATLPTEVQGPANDTDIVKEYQQARLGGQTATPESVGKILAANGRYVDVNTVQALVQRAQSKGQGWQEADKAFQDLFEVSPNSLEFDAIDWFQKINEARHNPLVSPFNFALDYFSGGSGRKQVPWRDQATIDRAIGLSNEPIAVPKMPPVGRVTPIGILAGLRTEPQANITPAMRESALAELRKRSGQ